jgi:hypothetical protein
MDDDERRRLDRHVYPRPLEDVIDSAILWGFRRPENQTWIRPDGMHVEEPRPFRCGFHRPDVEGPAPITFTDLQGIDGKTYRVGQCPRCGRKFWGVKGERFDPSGTI